MATTNTTDTTTTTPPPPLYRGPSPFGNKLLIVTVIFTFLAVLSIVLRLFIHVRHVGRLAADDWAILVSLVLLFGFMTENVILIERGGLGWPDTYVSPTQREFFYKVYYFNIITYCLITSSYKFTILFFYKRIFTVRWFQWVVKGMLAFVTAWLLVIFFCALFLAWPIDYNWKDVPGGHYNIDINIGYWGLGISNVVIDGVILLLPMPVVWRLKMSTRKKFGVTASFLLGGVVLISSILRLVALESLDIDEVMGTSGSDSLWSYIEVCTGIISACLPTLLPRFKRRLSRQSLLQKLNDKAPDGPESPGPTPQRISDPEMMTRALVGWGNEAQTQGMTMISVQTPSDVTPNRTSTDFAGRSWVDSETLRGSYRNSKSSHSQRPLVSNAETGFVDPVTGAPVRMDSWQNMGNEAQRRRSSLSSHSSNSSWSDKDSSSLDTKTKSNPKRSNASSAPSKFSGFSSESSSTDISPSSSLRRRKSCSDVPKVKTASLDAVLRRKWQEEALAALEGVIKEVRIEREIRVERIQL